MAVVSTVSPGEIANWSGQRADARQNMLGSKAQNAYQRMLSDLQYKAGTRDVAAKFDQARIGIPTQFAQRGLLNSGLYRNALARYAQERTNALAGVGLQQQLQGGNFILQDRNAEDSYASALMRILGETYGRQAQAATQIGGWL